MNPHQVAFSNRSGPGVGGVQQEDRSILVAAETGPVAETGVVDGMGRRRQELQRIAVEQIGVAVGTFPGRMVVGQRTEAGGGGPLGVELDASRRRRVTVPGEGVVDGVLAGRRPTVVPECLPIDTGDGRLIEGQNLLDDGFFILVELRIVEPQGLGQGAQQVQVGARLPERLDGLATEQETRMVIGKEDVVLLEGRGRRQDDIGVACGVGQEPFVDHREQVVSHEAPAQPVLVVEHGSRIAVHDEEALNGVAFQHASQVDHVVAGRRIGPEVIAFQAFEIAGEARAGREIDAAGPVAPGAGDGRQAGQRAQRHAGVGVALAAGADVDEGGMRRRQGFGEPADLGTGNACDLLAPLRGEPREDAREVFEAERMALDEVVVLQSLGDDHMHDRQRQGSVGAGARAEHEIGALGALDPNGIDDGVLGASFKRFLEKHLMVMLVGAMWPCTSPSVPDPKKGRMARGPSSSRIARQRSAITESASAQETVRKAPLPLSPVRIRGSVRRSGPKRRSGASLNLLSTAT